MIGASDDRTYNNQAHLNGVAIVNEFHTSLERMHVRDYTNILPKAKSSSTIN